MKYILAGCIGFFLFLALVGFLAYEAFSGNATPPAKFCPTYMYATNGSCCSKVCNIACPSGEYVPGSCNCQCYLNAKSGNSGNVQAGNNGQAKNSANGTVKNTTVANAPAGNNSSGNKTNNYIQGGGNAGGGSASSGASSGNTGTKATDLNNPPASPSAPTSTDSASGDVANVFSDTGSITPPAMPK